MRADMCKLNLIGTHQKIEKNLLSQKSKFSPHVCSPIQAVSENQVYFNPRLSDRCSDRVKGPP